MNNPVIFQKFPFVLEMKPGAYYWCACGRSKGQPFCDGSHKGSGFSPVQTDITETKKVPWCGCRNSKSGAFCDGSHRNLP